MISTPVSEQQFFNIQAVLRYGLRHVGELGLDYPQPIELEVDNATAITFSKDQVRRSKLRHISIQGKCGWRRYATRTL